MKNAGKIFVFGVLGFLGAGLVLSGCKSAPELTKANAQALIQAKYDQSPAVGINIAVDEKGLSQGVGASYWARTKLFPNRFWADFTLTPEGKKLVKLANGGDVIQWRPENAGDKNFSVVVVTVAAHPLKVHDLADPQDEVGGAKSVSFVESPSLEGVPNPLQLISSEPGNKLSSRHIATFVVEGDAWKLQSIN
ncbi:MAG TPA: hypothetical protein VMQ76_07845 [Terracidiphilus sp.]|nr:hypothetical protein [Terracidiphilus sp.]